MGGVGGEHGAVLAAGAVLSADAVLIPAEAFGECGPLIRDLNEWGKLWALCDVRAAEVSGLSGADGLAARARRLGVELSRCALLVTDERARRLARRAGVVGVEPWEAGASPGMMGRAQEGRRGRLRAAVESLMDRYQAISLRMLEATMREWGLERWPESTVTRRDR